MDDKQTEALRLLCDESDTFVQTIESLRRLIEVAHPEAASLDKNPQWRDSIQKATAALPPEKRGTFAATMVEAMPFALTIAVGGSHKPNTDTLDSEGEWVEADPLEMVPSSMRKGFAAARESMRQEVEDGAQADFEFTKSGRSAKIGIKDPQIRAHFWAIIERIEKDAQGPSHSAILIRSALTMAVSAFEVLVGNLFRAHITANPGATEDPQTKSFSLADLFEFGSIDDAIKETIFQQSDQFSRKGIRAWAKWFAGKPLGINLEDLAIDWRRTVEIFERRNVVVHNGSRATRQYLSNVDRSLTKDLKEGEPLGVTPEYIEDALTSLLTLGMLLSLRVRVKLFGKVSREATSDWITQLVFDMLLADQFVAVRHSAARAGELDLLQVNLNLLRVNGWIAQARIEDLDSIRAQVETWDTSALTLDFRTAKSVLLDDRDRALELIAECMKSERVTKTELLDWPLFHWLREAGALDSLIQQEAEESEDQVVEVTDDATLDEPGPPVLSQRTDKG